MSADAMVVTTIKLSADAVEGLGMACELVDRDRGYVVRRMAESLRDRLKAANGDPATEAEVLDRFGVALIPPMRRSGY